MKKLLLILLLFGLHLKSISLVPMDSIRMIQLDSIVSNTPKNIKKDLYLLHSYIHNLGKTDEERAWMFFAVFPNFIRYERKRMFEHKSLDYTPEYVINKRKGVCRDYALTFDRLCQLSNIPCIQITGKTPFNIILFMESLMHLKLPTTLHHWCLVKLNGSWKIMDPTWARVKEIKKYYSYDRNGTKKVVGKCKIIDRTYYDTNPFLSLQRHKPYHPAFYLLEEVPTYKSSFKNSYREKSKRKLYSKQYNYKTVLDSIYTNKHPELSAYMENESLLYSKKTSSSFFIKLKMNYHKRKVPRAYKPDLQDYYCHFEDLDSLSMYLLNEKDYYLEKELNDYKYLIDSLYIRKLEKKTKNKNKLIKKH